MSSEAPQGAAATGAAAPAPAGGEKPAQVGGWGWAMCMCWDMGGVRGRASWSGAWGNVDCRVGMTGRTYVGWKGRAGLRRGPFWSTGTEQPRLYIYRSSYPPPTHPR